MKTCAVAIEKDEPNAAEWLRWHLVECGFDRAVLFEDGRFAEVPAGLEGRVEQVAVSSLPAGFMPSFAPQFRCYCWYLAKMSAGDGAAAFLDLDEYMVLRGLRASEAFDRPGEKALAFGWAFFGSSLSEGPASSMALRFRRRAARTDRHVKTVLLLDKALPDVPYFCNPHFASSARAGGPVEAALPDGRRCLGPYDPLGYDPSAYPYIAHFYSKTPEEFEAKVARGRPDCGRESPHQYFRRRGEMLAERLRCDRNEVSDQSLAEAVLAWEKDGPWEKDKPGASGNIYVRG